MENLGGKNMSLIINYEGTSQIKEEYPERNDIEIWLVLHGWKIRKINAELDGKPLAELIHTDEKLIVAIDEKKKKMRVLNDIELEDF